MTEAIKTTDIFIAHSNFSDSNGNLISTGMAFYCYDENGNPITVYEGYPSYSNYHIGGDMGTIDYPIRPDEKRTYEIGGRLLRDNTIVIM